MNKTQLIKRTLRLPFGFLLIAIMFMASCKGVAQVASSRVEEVNGVAYYMHAVEKGQTLYAISKIYQCDVNEISAANPGSDEGIKEGSTIKIPVSKSKIKPPSNQTAVVSNSDFISHEVQRKETLYSISKHYNIDINELVAANPGSDAGVKKGQTLRIPLKKKVEDSVKIDASKSRKHVVSAGETLYSISRLYKVTVESIQQANGGLTLGLKIGQELIIPDVDESTKAEIGGTFPNKSNTIEPIEIKGEMYKDKYSIGLMLPFYINYSDTMDERDNMLREVALQIYRGAMMATDTLEAAGLRANLYTYDVINEKSSVTSALNNSEMKDMDVIIGPAFSDVMADVAKWGAQNGTHIVCPVQQPNKVLLSSPNMSKSVASAPTQWIAIARHIYKSSPKENIIIIDSKNIDDRRSIDAFKEEWRKLSGDSLKNIVVVNDASNFNVQEKYKAGETNIVIAPTNDKKVIGTLFRVLGENEVIVYGNESWDNLAVINVANRNKYKVHFPQTSFIDYDNVKVQKWIDTFRKKFKSEPNQFALLGFDLMMYYGMGLKQFGREFPNNFDHIQVKNMYAHGFDFVKTSNESGFENQYVMIIGTDEFKLVREN